MALARYIVPIDRNAVWTHLAAVLRILAALLGVPTLVALAWAEFVYAGLLGAIAATVFGLGWLGQRPDRPALGVREALAVTALAYLVASLLGAAAFWPVAPVVDGWFEAMSGFTATGLTLMPVDELPESLLFFRAYMQWIGGAGIIIIALAVLMRPAPGAHRLYASEFSEDNILGNVRTTVRIVAEIYLGMTLVGWLAYLIGGMAPWPALLYALTTISTAGFAPHGASLGHFDSTTIHLAGVLGMLLGSISFFLYYRAIREREGLLPLWRDVQVRALLGVVGVSTLAIWGAHRWGLDEFLPSLFHAVAALTTSGLHLTDPASWPDGVKLLAALLLVTGGSAGSTVGGIKLIRAIVLVRSAGWLVVRSLLPHEAKTPFKLGAFVVSDNELKELLGFMVIFIIIWILTALMLAFTGHGGLNAVFESASSLGIGGLSVGVATPELAVWGKVWLTLTMWLGRLELLPVLLVLYPRSWRRFGRARA